MLLSQGKNKDKKRLVEAPDADIKRIQTKILKFLQKIKCPNYVFSGVKNKSYVDNGRIHENKKCVFKTDINKFFPSIKRQKIYEFFNKKLNTSCDVANILANFSTVDISKKNNIKNDKIKKYIEENNLPVNHLITGSPLSSFLSYLVNEDMFEQLHELACKNNLTMSIYVDDVIYSTNANRISKGIKAAILKIIHANGYLTLAKKCRYYEERQQKIITGTVINPKYEKLQVPYKLMYKVHKGIEEIKNGDLTNLNKTSGCINAVNLIDKNKLIQLKKQVCCMKKNN